MAREVIIMRERIKGLDGYYKEEPSSERRNVGGREQNPGGITDNRLSRTSPR